MKFLIPAIVALALTSCAISPDGTRRYGQGTLTVDSSALKVHAQTARPLPKISASPDGSFTVEPATKLEELTLIAEILKLLSL